jgi:hypothetical protein
MQKASSGTAMRPSPKPKVERISVAMRTIRRTRSVVRWIGGLRSRIVTLIFSWSVQKAFDREVR